LRGFIDKQDVQRLERLRVGPQPGSTASNGYAGFKRVEEVRIVRDQRKTVPGLIRSIRLVAAL